ncbi:hypothetical protein [Streptococcus suis]|uniref:hypothetical protein n=1 Tax=Streptococcus suis TaxID=1307 RepID=UPI003BF874BE
MKEKLIEGVKNLVDKVNQISVISYTSNDSVIFESLKSNFNQICSNFMYEIEGSNIDFFYNDEQINVYFEGVLDYNLTNTRY